MSAFVGTWQTTRYTQQDFGNPETIILEITLDDDPSALDGSYPMPGLNARLHGPLVQANVWTAQIDEAGIPPDTSRVVFVLSDDGNTIHGAWQSSQHGGVQPWFGTRE